MPHFGPRVIGDDNFKKQAARQRVGAHHFGPRVVGQEQYDADGAPAPDPVKRESAPAAPAVAGISLADMQKLLAENPTFIDKLLKDEFTRPEGTRKSALELMLASETANRHRDAVVARLKDALGILPEQEPDYENLTVAQLTELAGEWSIDLGQFEGSGAGGKLVKADLIGILQESFAERRKAKE